MLALTMQIDKRFGNSGFSRGADFLEHPDSSDREDLRIGWVMRKMHGLILNMQVSDELTSLKWLDE